MDMTTVQEQPTVLVVEDNEELIALYTRWLQDFCTVKTATNCEAAYSCFADDIDVALLDRDLPDGSGDDILERIREMELGWRVAFVSGINPSLEDLEKDFDEYLQKPVERDEITTIVERLYLRSVIGARLNEFYALEAKKKTLEQHYPSHELLSKEKYAQVESRLEELYAMLQRSHSIALTTCGSPAK